MSNPYESSAVPAARVSSTKAVQIKRLGVLSCGKMAGALYAIFGLIAGAVVTLLALAGASLDGDNAPGILGVGAAAIVMFPIMYGIGGFIVGLLGALFYNLVASIAGGIEIHTSERG